MDPEELKMRTKQFGLRFIHLVQAMPNNPKSRVIGKRRVCCATSVVAKYRAL